MFSHLQRARQTKCPEEFVEYIELAIPLNANMEDPFKDTTFMSQIGANKPSESDRGGGLYEMKNAATGTLFKFKFALSQNKKSFSWILRKTKLC